MVLRVYSLRKPNKPLVRLKMCILDLVNVFWVGFEHKIGTKRGKKETK